MLLALASSFADLATSPQTWLSLATLTLMEVVLGIDNIVFISILTGKLPEKEQPKARKVGLLLALIMRIGLLFAITWLMGLIKPLFTLPVLNQPLSGRDLILLGGGLFLIYKATHEIYEKLEVSHKDDQVAGGSSKFSMILVQIVLLDIVFSLDSVITAVGMAGGATPEAVATCTNCGKVPVAPAASHGGGGMPVMITAMVLSMLVMLVSAGAISNFVNRHPSVKILALSFLLLIGVMLVAEGLGKHIEKGYIYAAMAFSLAVELFNMRFRRRKQDPVHLHHDMESLKPEATV